MLSVVQAFPWQGWATPQVTSHSFPPPAHWTSWRYNISTAITALCVRLLCLSQETMGHDPIAHLHYGCLPYLLPDHEVHPTAPCEPCAAGMFSTRHSHMWHQAIGSVLSWGYWKSEVAQAFCRDTPTFTAWWALIEITSLEIVSIVLSFSSL